MKKSKNSKHSRGKALTVYVGPVLVAGVLGALVLWAWDGAKALASYVGKV